MSTFSQETRFPSSLLHAQVESILIAWGLAPDIARESATIMTDADLSGIDSHGISMLAMYERLIADGRLDPHARPRVVQDSDSFVVIDARHGMGHPAGLLATRLAMERARRNGVGLAVVRNSNHYGALGFYARVAAAEGLVALLTTTTRTPTVAALGGKTPILGTNPIAFAAPRADGPPIVVDMSTSIVALNKVKAHALAGLPLPDGWVMGRDGRRVTDAVDAYDRLMRGDATLTPLGGSSVIDGGHKGFGLNLMVHILSAALSGAEGAHYDGEYDNLGHFVLTLDPGIIRPTGDFGRSTEQLVAAVRHGEPRVVIPGDPEHETRIARLRDGIPMPPALVTQLKQVAERANAPFVIELAS